MASRPGASNYSVALFLGRIKDAIVQRQEVGGRAFFANAGKHPQRRRGGRALSVTPVGGLTLRGAYTYAHYRFTDYVDAAGNSLDGQSTAGRARPLLALRPARLPCPGDSISTPTTRSAPRSWPTTPTRILSSDSWGAGVTNLRVGWSGDVGQHEPVPVHRASTICGTGSTSASVTMNGVVGRVIEPAPRRVIYVGSEVGYRTGRRRQGLEQRDRVAVDHDPHVPRGGADAAPHSGPIRPSTCDGPFSSTCQRHRSLMRASGHGAGPSSVHRQLVPVCEQRRAPIRHLHRPPSDLVLVRSRHQQVHQRRRRRIRRRFAQSSLLAAGSPGCRAAPPRRARGAPDAASAPAPGLPSARDPHGLPPGPAAERCARPSGSPADRDRCPRPPRPTSVTFGKSSPFAIICVPSSRSTSPASTAARMRWCDHLVLVVSRSIRASRASG